MEKKTRIQNESGLHARPASILVMEATKFKSDIEIEYDGKIVNAKSLMGLISLGLGHGSEIKITANGEDEEAAVNTIIKLVENKFNEE